MGIPITFHEDFGNFLNIPIVGGLEFLQTALQVYAVALLFTKSSNLWFRQSKLGSAGTGAQT